MRSMRILLGKLEFIVKQYKVKRIPQDSINDFVIQTLNPLICSCRFQIHLCIETCVMSSELTSEVVMKFPPVQFP